ncbi:TPA: hypothetical protein WI034_000540 [Neisseria meningitidis]|uniref:hypothetical protein n=1 Tax=Neisseria meningitidis TaxID=487 RepID=UPI00027C8190|nr:hypothetical protein [Neisseria meningitidis]EJU79758.1 identified by MetaGeneAnnotator [Neisseria meningitidis NM3081]ELL28766.1 putative identified by MetaGeneAnnotator [Neisseria meningitidis 77221]MBG9159023.1 hypothetical protein [Neisseria meningitidis]MBG9167460.1 hypothetical protein [Neisseria meningitidis]MBG9196289.1 hypothetical protein [Neisseria meningitidis]
MKYIVSISLAMGLAACSFGGFKPPPDDSVYWKYSRIEQEYPAMMSKNINLRIYSYEEYSKQIDDLFAKEKKDWKECGYDPIGGGGGSKADACMRKRGWYRVGDDIYPENKKYEWPREN